MALKITNKHNLPSPLYNAISTNNHVMTGDFSVTQIIDAPQISTLKKLNDYEMDVMDFVPMVVGTSVHDYLEKMSFSGNHKARALQEAAGILNGMGEDKAGEYLMKMIADKLEEEIDSDVIMEQNLTMEIDGMILSGTFDRFTQSTGLLEDYKTTSANSMMFPETKSSYSAQLNIYAMLLKANGYNVKAARIIAILKDHSRMKIMQNKDYPKQPIVMMDIPLLEESVVMSYLRKRVDLHKRALNGEHIPCSKKDRWAKGDTFKVKKTGGKRSLKNFDSKKMAGAFVAENEFKYKEGLWIDEVKSTSFRCANGYCAMSHVCEQYAKEKEQISQQAENM